MENIKQYGEVITLENGGKIRRYKPYKSYKNLNTRKI